jgi:hypothetical protein
MRRVIPLALLALALPTAALASSVSGDFSTENFRNDSTTRGFSPDQFGVSVLGNMDQIVLNTSNLSGCFGTGRFCKFSHGIGDVKLRGATIIYGQPRQRDDNDMQTVSMLGLLGTGLIGLAGMARRKLKLGT